MESYKLRVPTLDFLYKKTGPNSQRSPETDMTRDSLDDLQPSKAELTDQMADLRAQNKELDAYASTVAHDLRDPLYAILLTSNLMTNAPSLTQAEWKSYSQKITSTAHQMNTIINNLLVFAKVNSTEALVERVDMDLAVANALSRLDYSINEHHATISIPESWPVAIGYTSWIEEVWANYLSNAIKYGGSPLHAELGASLQPNGLIRYWIRDNGPGLSADEQAQLFTPFSQITHVGNLGHGLGLSIILRIVEKLGGQVGCESEPGKGSLFFFTLRAETPVFNSREKR